MCGVCGDKQFEFFNVPNEEWETNVPLYLREKVICRPCYDKISKWMM